MCAEASSGFTPAFANEEYRSRTARLRSLLAERGVDALLVMNEANMNYLTGYEGFSEYIPQLALVLQDQEDPFLILREMDMQCATPTSYLDPSRILSYPETHIGTASRTPWEAIGPLIRERTKSKRVGVELTAISYGIKAHAALTQALGGGDLLDGDGIVNRLKLVKSDAEITYMKQAARIVDRAMHVGMLNIAVGAREADVAAAVMHALSAGTPEHAGGAPHPATMAPGRISNAPHLKWTDARYARGTQTNFEIGAFRRRYCCPLSRTVYLGTPPDRLKHIHEAVLEGFLAGFAAMRPGATCGDVERAFRKAFTPFGVRKESRIGYSIGIDWADGGASLQADDPTVLATNMTFHLIIGIWEKQEGYILSEAVRITEKGAESFSRMPRHMLVNE